MMVRFKTSSARFASRRASRAALRTGPFRPFGSLRTPEAGSQLSPRDPCVGITLVVLESSIEFGALGRSKLDLVGGISNLIPQFLEELDAFGDRELLV